MSIIITKEGMTATRLDKSSFESEKSLQQFIHINPETLPINDIKENMRLLIVAREFQTNSGPIDAIGIDADGGIYLIETKLYKNSDKRFVVAQVLDYGASLSKYSRDIHEFLLLIEEQMKNQFAQSLSEKFKEYFAIENDEEYDELIENIRLNFVDGRFKFVVLMDKISERLKDLILFINESSEFSIYAVQFDYYKYEQFEIVIPKIVGVEADHKKEMRPSASNRKKDWQTTEDEFYFEVRKKFNDEDVQKIKKLIEFGKAYADHVKWIKIKDEDVKLFMPINIKTSWKGLFTLVSDGNLSQHLTRKNLIPRTIKYIEEFEKIMEKHSWKNLTELDSGIIYAAIPFETWSPVVDELIEELDKLIVKN